MNAFGNMGTFCGVPKVAYWKKGDPKPSVRIPIASEYQLDLPWWNPDLPVSGLEAQFLSYLKWIRDGGQEVLGNTIETLLNETRLLKEIEDWHSFLQHSINHFRESIHSWREEYENLLSSWRATEEEQQAQANAIRYQLSALHAITVIESLADRQFLPHYGFPIGVQKLRVIVPDQEYRNKVREEDQYRIKNLGDIQGLDCHYQEDGEILVYNKGEENKGFAICLKCGFAESEMDYGEGIMNLPPDFDNHAPLHSSNSWMRCWSEGEHPILRGQMLAAREITDVLMVDFMKCLDFQARDRALITTLGYALQRAGVQILELDMREIGVMTVPAGKDGSGWGIVLYDNVAGGAGHVRELLGLGRLWLEEALRVLYVNSDHHDRCETACLDCLLGIDAQIAVSRGLLKRKQAHRVLALLLQRSPLSQLDKTSKQENHSSENTRIETPKTDSGIDSRDLLRKAQERIKRRK